MALNRISAEIRQTSGGGTTHFSNSLPYAVRLQNGWSKQALAGMVTVLEFPLFVSQAAADAKK